LLLVAILLVNTPDCHLSLVIASVVQSDAVNYNTTHSAFQNHAQAAFDISAID